ncbi:hypothetical protein BDV18DRAFT_163775 [Aspergillus unguis]
MSYSPAIPSNDLLDGRLEDIQYQSLRPVCMTPVQDENAPPLIDGTEDLLGSIADKLKIAALDPKCAPRTSLSLRHLRDPTLSNTISETMRKTVTGLKIRKWPWDGNINWALKGSSIFNDADEELNAFYSLVNMLGHQPYTELWIFQYGLRYIPSVSDNEVYRTIRIEELPKEVQLNQILPLIAGEIYCARLTDTSTITGHNTALITFVTQEDAINFVSAVAAKKIAEPLGKVVPVHTPTYPIPADTERLILDEGYTRTIGIFHSRPTLRMEIARALGNPHQSHILQLESINDGPGIGEVSIRMLSVKAAAAAFEWLRRNPALSKCQFRFLKQDGTPSEERRTSLESGIRAGGW